MNTTINTKPITRYTRAGQDGKESCVHAVQPIVFITSHGVPQCVNRANSGSRKLIIVR